MNCNSGITIPPLNPDPCLGETKNTQCVIHQDALVLLDLPANSSIYDIVNAFSVALSAATNRLDALEALTIELEARIETLENV